MIQENIKYLVTNALPYANGHLHLGHILGYVQADIWVRTQRLLNNTCHYICGDDAHGTPIMISAKKNNMTPEEFVAGFYDAHIKDFADFNIKFDNFSSTNSIENQELVQEIYQSLKTKNYIICKDIEQAYDSTANMFLPDRYIKGTCPKCKTADQYGDSCEHCGATYSPTDLIEPKSVITDTTPIRKISKHYFFDLPSFTQELKTWLNQGHLQEQIKHKLIEWFEHGLKPWDISRDEPYFGFKIPDTNPEEGNKYFYVWLDAPIGYMASFKQYINQNKNLNLNFDDYWKDNNQNTKLVHFIGKDITYFHALFWPAVLSGSGHKKPDNIYVNGFVTVNGKKMSKSRGTFILARKYLDNLDPDYLRYYFAAKLSRAVEDIDLNLEDFTQRVNSDLIGKLVNIASRCSGFINKKYDNILSDNFDLLDYEYQKLYTNFINSQDKIINHYLDLNYSYAIREIMALTDKANQFIDHYKPWALIKDDKIVNHREITHQVCSLAINLYRILISYLYPVIPSLAHRSAEFLNIDLDELKWDHIKNPLFNHKINKFKQLLSRIDPVKVNNIVK